MNIVYSIAIIAVVAIVTFMTRACPFFLFGGKKEVPAVIVYLGKVLPSAIMVTLVVYCFRNINVLEGSFGIPEFFSAILVAVLHIWKRNILLSISVGTICYMVLVQCIF